MNKKMNNIDHIYYINLDKRIDRKHEFEAQIPIFFNEIKDNVERFPAIFNSNGAIGCCSSHIEVLKKARTQGYKYIIIFEDDFQFIVTNTIFYNNIHKLFELVNNGLDFKVVMLSYNALNKLHYNDLLDISTNVQTASGYLVNCKYIDELINCLENGLDMFCKTGKHWLYTNDQSWKTLQQDNKWFLFKERIGIQRPSFSDLGGCFVDNKC